MREEVVDEAHARVVVQAEFAVEALGGFWSGLLVWDGIETFWGK